jgi:putative Mn2+ efflux pump MntP
MRRWGIELVLIAVMAILGIVQGNSSSPWNTIAMWLAVALIIWTGYSLYTDLTENIPRTRRLLADTEEKRIVWRRYRSTISVSIVLRVVAIFMGVALKFLGVGK